MPFKVHIIRNYRTPQRQPSDVLASTGRFTAATNQPQTEVTDWNSSSSRLSRCETPVQMCSSRPVRRNIISHPKHLRFRVTTWRLMRTVFLTQLLAITVRTIWHECSESGACLHQKWMKHTPNVWGFGVPGQLLFLVSSPTLDQSCDIFV